MTHPTTDTSPVITNPANRSNLGLIIGSILAVAVLGVGSILAIVIYRPGADNAVLIATILGFLGPTAAALLALIKTVQTGADVKELHLAVNSRLTQLLELTARASRAEGREDTTAAVAKAATEVAAAAATAAANTAEGTTASAANVAAEAAKAAAQTVSPATVASEPKQEATP